MYTYSFHSLQLVLVHVLPALSPAAELLVSNSHYYQCYLHTIRADMSDLADVLEIVLDVQDWSRLGMILGLLYQPTLTDIDTHRRGKQDDCKKDMLAAWLQQQDNVPQKGVPSWSVLRAALQRMGYHELANRISTN